MKEIFTILCSNYLMQDNFNPFPSPEMLSIFLLKVALFIYNWSLASILSWTTSIILNQGIDLRYCILFPSIFFLGLLSLIRLFTLWQLMVIGICSFWQLLISPREGWKTPPLRSWKLLDVCPWNFYQMSMSMGGTKLFFWHGWSLL